MSPSNNNLFAWLVIIMANFTCLTAQQQSFHQQSSQNDYQYQNYSVVHHLMWRLFSRYHKAATLVRPVIVNLDVLLIKVKGTVEKEGIFETVIAIFIRWHDSRLVWDPAEYQNITSLSLDPEQVGLPDIAMINSADHLYGITRHNKFQVQLSSNGNMKYVPTGTARTWCDLKLFTFPFDVQKCSLEFESWSLDHKSMTFDGLSDIVLDKAFTSQLWNICDLHSTTYDQTYFTNETFTRVRFDITVKRRQTFYVVNLIFPCTTLSLIQLSVFWISSTDTTADRIGFSTTNLLTLVVFQTIVTEELPKTSDAVTALSKYIIALILTSAIGIFESVIIERFFRTFQKPPPWWLFRICKPLPILWRELPTTHPDLEEAQQICLSMRRSRQEEKEAAKQAKVQQARNVKSRPTICTSPVFSRRSSLLNDVNNGTPQEKARLIVKTVPCICCDNLSTLSANNAKIAKTSDDPWIPNYAAINHGFVGDNNDAKTTKLSAVPSLVGAVAIPLIPLSGIRSDSIEDDGVFTGRQSNLNNNSEQNSGGNGNTKKSDKNICSSGGSSDSVGNCSMKNNGDCQTLCEDEVCSECGEVITCNKNSCNRSNNTAHAFFFHRNNDNTSQRIITLPAISPRLQEQLHFQAEEGKQQGQTRQSNNSKKRGNTTNRRGSKSPNVIMQRLQERNACLWMELGFKIDFLTFLLCLLLSILIPVGLFVPLIYLGNSCVPSHTLDYG